MIDDNGNYLWDRELEGRLEISSVIQTSDSAYLAIGTRGIFKIVQNFSTIEASENNIIGVYQLSQNYPNPFNPSTTIEFTLPKSEFVELKVYNILGKEVSTLVSKKLNQGNHTYTFDGRILASGVYYYQLVAGDYMEVKKMILIR
jgi:hypothetical protein